MNLTKPTRRNFLTSMAILSAGAAFGSFSDLFTSGKQKIEFQKKWETFCKLSGGKFYDSFDGSNTYSNNEACKGHQYKTGKAIFFNKENLIAIPTWIFWESDKRKPSDMLITFFEKKNGGLEKTITYNRYEMEAIYKTYEKLNELSFVKSATPEKFKMKTLIAKHKIKQEIGYFRGKEILFRNNFNYTI